jgi:ribosomal protein S18 acetylase RimI-like enzyme
LPAVLLPGADGGTKAVPTGARTAVTGGVVTTVVTTGTTVRMTGARVLVTVVTTGANAPVTGAKALMTGVTTGVSAPVTGNRVLMSGVTTGVTAPVSGDRVLMIGVTAGVTAPVTGASVLTTVVTMGVTAPVTGVTVLTTVVTAGATARATGATVLAAVFTTGVTVPMTGASVLVVALATGAAASATGASVLVVALATGAAELAVDADVLAVVPTIGAVTAVMGATVLATLVTTGAAVLVAGAKILATGAAVLVTGAGPVAPEAAATTGGTVELTIEVIGDAAAVTVSPVVVWVDRRGGSAAVAAWAGRENSSMITKMPAAASAACIAPRANRRTIGCSMSSPTRRETGPLAYPRRRRQTSRTQTCCSVTTVQLLRQPDKGETPRKKPLKTTRVPRVAEAQILTRLRLARRATTPRGGVAGARQIGLRRPGDPRWPAFWHDGRMSLVLRAGTAADVDGLLGLWAEAAENAERAPDTREAVAAVLGRDPDAVIVAEDEGELVGSVIAGWDGWRCHLYRLAVRPAWRRRGVASALLQAAEDRFIAVGATRADAMVLDGNDLGQSLWRAGGYLRQDEWRRWVKKLG